MPRISNPVLTGFHPDPSILRVKDTYYIANSTFEWFPGVELHRSKDLCTWESLPSPLNTGRLLDMTGEYASCGIWAPCLSYSDEEHLFYLIYTNVRNWCKGPWKDTPNFLTTAPSIEGPWSTPVFLNASGFDPSLFHDDDGRKWLINMEWDWRGERGTWKQFSGLLLQEYSPSTKRLVGPVRKIFTGSDIGKVEGPHLYKHDGFYYIIAAEGGTGYTHAATMARSKSLFGPYEIHPHNPLLTSTGYDGVLSTVAAVQKAGHASICDSADGKRTYIAYLCGRPLPGTKNCPLGRETGICEAQWIDGWLYVKGEPGTEFFSDGIAQNYPPASFAPPGCAEEDARVMPPVSTSYSMKYTFGDTSGEGGSSESASIHPDFKTLRCAADPKIYSLNARRGFLRLRGGQSPASTFGQNLLARRQTDFCFSAETYMESTPKSHQEFAGLIWRYDEDNQYLLCREGDEKNGTVLAVQTMIAGMYARSKPVPLGGAVDGVYLGLTVRGKEGRFRYSLDGKSWRFIGPILETAVLSDEFGCPGFTGAFTGLYSADLGRYKGHADFAYFDYRVL